MYGSALGLVQKFTNKSDQERYGNILRTLVETRSKGILLTNARHIFARRYRFSVENVNWRKEVTERKDSRTTKGGN